MKKIFYLISLGLLISIQSCGGNGTASLTQEQNDSIALVKADSIRYADSIAAVEQAKADSIAQVLAKEKEAIIAKLSKKFWVQKDEFSDRTWIYHNTTPKYRNRNSIHLYFMTENGNTSNLRFCVQYEADDWLFIQNMIFNVDGENITYVPYKMETDCGYGGRIWEWCDEQASSESDLVEKIANAKTVKIKLNGRQYYNTRTMSAKQIVAFKETLEYYKLLGGSLEK